MKVFIENDDGSQSLLKQDQKFIVEFLDDLGEGASVLTVSVTSEGIIMDYIKDENIIGTRGMTYDEWTEEIKEEN
jgi:hypothetical protein